jgi:hypothetical protein
MTAASHADAAAARLAALRGQAIPLAQFVFMDFRSGPLRLWSGVGDVEAGGQVWLGHGGLISIPDIPGGTGFFSSKIELTLSGLPDDPATPAAMSGLYASLMQQQRDLRGRRVTIHDAALDHDGGLIGDLETAWAGVMDKLSYQRNAAGAALKLSCETAFVSRRRPRFAYYTDEFQQSLHPGDRIFEFASATNVKIITWPTV